MSKTKNVLHDFGWRLDIGQQKISNFGHRPWKIIQDYKEWKRWKNREKHFKRHRERAAKF